MDDQVGIGANERQAARGHRAQPILVIVRRFHVVVEQSGAEDIGRLFQRRELRPHAGRSPRAASNSERSRPARYDGPARGAFGDQRDGDVARCHHRVERVGRNAEGDLLPYRRAGTGALVIRTTAPPRRLNATRRVGSGSKGFAAVVDDAPDVAEDRVIAVGDLAEPRDA